MDEKEKPQVRDLRNGDWYWVNKLVLDHPYLNSSAKLVYMALAYYANNETQKAYPTFNKIMKLTGLKRRILTSATKQLEEYHFLKVERKRGKISEYTLLKLTDSKPVQKMHSSIPKFLPGSGWLKEE